MTDKDIKVIFVPGNGDDGPDERWRPKVMCELAKLGLGTINLRFPDSMKARKKYWLPYLEQLGADGHTILIGHSSGAVAAMRYAETHNIFGSVLIGVCYTDLGDAGEKESGYFDTPWNWDAIKKNQNWIIQFGSKDDPYIPVEEFRHVHMQLNTEYHEFDGKAHFGEEAGDFPELVQAINNKVIIE